MRWQAFPPLLPLPLLLVACGCPMPEAGQTLGVQTVIVGEFRFAPGI